MRTRFNRNFLLFIVLPALFVTLPMARGYGQDKVKEHKEYKEVAKNREFCSSNNWNSSDKVSTSELREMTVASTGKLDVDGARNGGISIKGENRSDVLVRACVQTWGSSEAEAKSLASSIKINLGGTIKADGPEENWSVSYEIRAPRNSNLTLKAHNGGISVKGVDGTMDFVTVNGGVNVSDAAGDVKGRTTNGGINVSLVGNGWKGTGLDLQTTNGGVNLTIPSDFAANVEAGTVNGGFSSDIPALNITTEDVKGDYGRQKAKKINTSLNGGGAPVRVVTTNGGIRINSSSK
jgi:DUF4097 and DUF4098 domain-containing protein YvlB